MHPLRYHRAMASTPPGTIAGSALREAKRALRVDVLARRDALSPQQRARDSQAIARRLAARADLRGGIALLVTLPFGSEWDTSLLVRHARDAAATVAVPRVDPKARMLVLHVVRDPDADVVPGHLGIPEPRPDCAIVAPAAIDVVVVPGVAFDAQGGRLGYGGGYYDRLLPLLRAGVPRLAGAFDEQIVARVPRAAHDLAVDCVVTPTRELGGPRR